MTIKEFGKNAVALSGRPIGIIALFILLVYASFAAALVSGEGLTEIQRSLIIGFMIIYSCLVLYVFYSLVTKHPGKLYSPKDFNNEDHFLEVIREKLHQDISTDVEKEINKRISNLEEELKYETLYIRMLNAKSQGFNQKALSYSKELEKLREPTSDLLKFKAYFLGNLRQYTEALASIEKSIELDGFSDEFERAKARFNRACYKNMLNHPEEDIFADLEAAIAVDECFIEWCKDDGELKSLDLTSFLARYA